MSIMRKDFNSDSHHQYIIDDNKLISVTISFDKNAIKHCMSQLLCYDNNSNCLLMCASELKKYNFPVKMYLIGFFNLDKEKESTFNYLVPNNKLLFLLNYFYQKAEKGISLNNEDLNLLHGLKTIYEQHECKKELALIQELKDNIIFNIKGIYDYKRVEKITLDTINILMQEKFPLNPLYVSGILDNAIDNTAVLDKLNVELNKGYQKTKA